MGKFSVLPPIRPHPTLHVAHTLSYLSHSSAESIFSDLIYAPMEMARAARHGCSWQWLDVVGRDGLVEKG